MGNHGLSVLGRFEIPAGRFRLVTQRRDVSVTLWVERGVVQLAQAEEGRHGAELSGGPILLDSGPVALHSIGDEPALVFAAVCEIAAAAECAEHRAAAVHASALLASKERSLTELRRTVLAPPSDVDSIRSRRYVAACVGPEHWTSGSLPYSAALAAGNKHKEDTGHEYNLEPL